MSRLDTPSLAGQLLVAHPSLRDPNFFRTVIFIVSHSAEDGAMGFILNRPINKDVSEITADWEAAALLSDIPLRWGGPVGGNQISLAMFKTTSTDKTSAGLEWHGGLSLEALPDLIKSGMTNVHAFIGYAGWSAGQLESELRRRSWILQQPLSELFENGLDNLWPVIISRLGPLFRLEALAPENPWLN